LGGGYHGNEGSGYGARLARKGLTVVTSTVVTLVVTTAVIQYCMLHGYLSCNWKVVQNKYVGPNTPFGDPHGVRRLRGRPGRSHHVW